MLKIGDYRRRSDQLADHLPWAALVAPGVVLNKDGSFQRTLRYRGPDLESVTDAELVAICARANNVLRRFGSGWALFFDASRVQALSYPDGAFPDAVSGLIDAERRAGFEAAGAHFESHFHITLLWQPPADQTERVGRLLLSETVPVEGRDWRNTLQVYLAETERALDLLAQFMPEVVALNDQETLTFLHALVSEQAHPVAVPDTPMYLDALLADTAMTGGFEPMLGAQHIRTVTLRGFPAMSRPALLDSLNHQAFAYRWASRFIPLDKAEANRTLTRLRRHWFNKRKSVTALLREVMYNQPAQLLDSDADNKVIDADLALQALGEDHVTFGYLTVTVTVADTDRAAVEDKLRAVERVVNGLGFTCTRERLNGVEAWLSSLAGHVYANVRQPLVHTLNLAHLMPLSSVWAGPDANAHLQAAPLLVAQTSGTTPFRLSTHVGDVGHMLIAGPTGAGKSVLLALMALQFRRYRDARIWIFDKGMSARAVVLAMGGAHYALGLGIDGRDLAFQPLRAIDQPAERSWAAEWIAALVEHEKLLVTPDLKQMIWSALSSLASAPPDERTLTGLTLLIQSQALKAALQPYTMDGAFGTLLDASDESLSLRDITCFETEALMSQPSAIAPVLTYLFHKLEVAFDGRPTLLMLDEAWMFLDHPLFAARIREWLKVLRKKNVAVVFATQSLADIANSPIAPAIIESCPQRILLPNERAAEPQSQAIYQRFGLNARQIELIAQATPKRQYYLQSARGNRLFELGLGPATLALCGSSEPSIQKRIDALLATHGSDRFASHFLADRGLPWAAALAHSSSFTPLGDVA
jgi:type IV secretion system protein VirB4